jgi:signal peptidase II
MERPSLSLFKWNVILFSISITVVIIDQLTKLWIQNNFAIGQSLPETGFFRLTYAQNTGAAFSIFYGHVEILTVVSCIGVILLLIYLFYVSRKYPALDTAMSRIALGLILGGAIGNLIDRMTLGYVRDFIDVGPWPIFNIADSATTVGVIIFAIFILFFSGKIDRDESKKPEDR